MRLRAALGLVLVLAAVAGISALATQGPFADTIVFDVRMTEDIALRDVAAGSTDAFWYASPRNVFGRLDQPTMDSFEFYFASSRGVSLLLNPYPNVAPYIARDADDGTETFNPFAIQAVRFAMHNLIDRTLIRDQFFERGAEACLLAVPPSSAGAHVLYAEAAALGLTDEGNEALAIASVTAAIESAAALPSMTARLTKSSTADPASAVGFWWTFDGRPVAVLGLIRVDDPNVKLPIGRYVADQIRKCGIQVEEVDRARDRVAETAYRSDPARMLWHFCTEELDATNTLRWREKDVARCYSMWYAGLYPGGGVEGRYNFIDPRAEELTQRLVYGQFGTLDEYWALMAEATRVGLEDAVRIYLAQETGYYVVNEQAFADRFLYGLGDGLNRWSTYTMIPTSSGVVRLTQFSSRGSLFTSAWDPVGVSGFSDSYSSRIVEPCTDPFVAPAPGSGRETPILVDWSNVQTGIDVSGEEPLGTLAVPGSAVSWNTTTQEWVSRGGEVAWATAEYTLVRTAFHDGTTLSLLDVAAAEGFRTEWATEDFEGDPKYDSAYSAVLSPGFTYAQGSVYDYAHNKVTAYFDYYSPDTNRIAAAGTPSLWASAVDHGQGVKWTVVEALGRMVASGTSASGTAYGFGGIAGRTEVDVLWPSCAADIRSELVAMRDEKVVPPYLRTGMNELGLTESDIAGMYQMAIDFIDNHGHAYISNGGFIMSEFDPAWNQITLSANRSPSYPFTGQGWLDLFKVDIARVDDVRVPVDARCGQDVTVEIMASQALFPYDVFEPATTLDIRLAFVRSDGTSVTVAASQVGVGTYSATIPGSSTEGLASGSYALAAIATPAAGMPVALQSWLKLICE